MGIDILPMDYNAFLGSQDFRRANGLLVNDSLILSCMKQNKIKKIASNDEAFLSAKPIEVYGPDDVNL